MYHTPMMMNASHISLSNRPTHSPVRPAPSSLSVRPERSGAVNTASKRPSAEVVLTAPRSRRTQIVHPEQGRRAQIALRKTPSKMSHCDKSSATKMSQTPQKCDVCDVPRYENHVTLFRIWPAREMSQLSHFSATKKLSQQVDMGLTFRFS